MIKLILIFLNIFVSFAICAQSIFVKPLTVSSAEPNGTVKSYVFQVVGNAGKGYHLELNSTFPDRGHKVDMIQKNDLLIYQSSPLSVGTKNFDLEIFLTSNDVPQLRQTLISITDEINDLDSRVISLPDGEERDVLLGKRQQLEEKKAELEKKIDGLVVKINSINIVTTVFDSEAPVANFFLSSNQGEVPFTVSVDASSSTGQGINSYLWDFDDDSVEDEKFKTGLTQTFTYNTPGNYTINLEVTNELGKSSTINKEITVLPSEIPLPVAFFQMNQPVAQVAPHTVTFDASGSTVESATIDSYEWTFGDGSTAAGRVVEHTFTSEGIFAINLTITDSNSNQSSYQGTVLINCYQDDGDNTCFTIEGAHQGIVSDKNEQITFTQNSSLDLSQNLEDTQITMIELNSGKPEIDISSVVTISGPSVVINKDDLYQFVDDFRKPHRFKIRTKSTGGLYLNGTVNNIYFSTGTIVGHLNDLEPEGIVVRLYSIYRGIEREVTLDSSGNFTFADLPFDGYQIISTRGSKASVGTLIVAPFSETNITLNLLDPYVDDITNSVVVNGEAHGISRAASYPYVSRLKRAKSYPKGNLNIKKGESFATKPIMRLLNKNRKSGTTFRFPPSNVGVSNYVETIDIEAGQTQLNLSLQGFALNQQSTDAYSSFVLTRNDEGNIEVNRMAASISELTGNIPPSNTTNPPSATAGTQVFPLGIPETIGPGFSVIFSNIVNMDREDGDCMSAVAEGEAREDVSEVISMARGFNKQELKQALGDVNFIPASIDTSTGTHRNPYTQSQYYIEYIVKFKIPEGHTFKNPKVEIEANTGDAIWRREVDFEIEDYIGESLAGGEVTKIIRIYTAAWMDFHFMGEYTNSIAKADLATFVITPKSVTDEFETVRGSERKSRVNYVLFDGKLIDGGRGVCTLYSGTISMYVRKHVAEAIRTYLSFEELYNRFQCNDGSLPFGGPLSPHSSTGGHTNGTALDTKQLFNKDDDSQMDMSYPWTRLRKIYEAGGTNATVRNSALSTLSSWYAEVREGFDEFVRVNNDLALVSKAKSVIISDGRGISCYDSSHCLADIYNSPGDASRVSGWNFRLWTDGLLPRATNNDVPNLDAWNFPSGPISLNRAITGHLNHHHFGF